MDLLKNAIGSIKIGVEDSESNEHDRLLSAVRNIHAGILLLYKEKLRRLSPSSTNEALIKADIFPTKDQNGAVVFVGRGKRTVDVQQIKARFKSLGIATDWQRFHRISEVRNDFEHYYATVSEAALRGLISDAFVLIRDFIRGELGDDPRALLGEETWQELLSESEVFEKERKVCQESLESIDWKSEALSAGVLRLECESCGAALLQAEPASTQYENVELVCRACGEKEPLERFAERAVASALGQEMYLSHADGNETPYVQCPTCIQDTYVVAEGKCVVCGEQLDDTCARCACRIPPEELDGSGFCSWCAHMMSKDD